MLSSFRIDDLLILTDFPVTAASLFYLARIFRLSKSIEKQKTKKTERGARIEMGSQDELSSERELAQNDLEQAAATPATASSILERFPNELLFYIISFVEIDNTVKPQCLTTLAQCSKQLLYVAGPLAYHTLRAKTQRDLEWIAAVCARDGVGSMVK